MSPLFRPAFTALFFFFNDTATTEIYTLSLHDALPIFLEPPNLEQRGAGGDRGLVRGRSEEHTSELQSRFDLVCRLLLEKKNLILFIDFRYMENDTVNNCKTPHPTI